MSFPPFSFIQENSAWRVLTIWVLCEKDGQFFLHLVNMRPTCVGSTSNCPATLVCPGDFPVLQAVDLKAAIPHPNAIHPDCPDKSCLDETCSRHGTCSEGHVIIIISVHNFNRKWVYLWRWLWRRKMWTKRAVFGAIHIIWSRFVCGLRRKFPDVVPRVS